MKSDLMQAIQANLPPAVLFFLLGVFATRSKSDLKFPEPLSLSLTIFFADVDRGYDATSGFFVAPFYESERAELPPKRLK